MNQKSATINNAVVHLDDDSFQTSVIEPKQLALVDFWADWCQPCHKMAPTVDTLAEEYGDRVLVAKVDVDANPMTTHTYGIRGIPALLLFKEGKLVQQIVGVKPKEEVARIIESYL